MYLIAFAIAFFVSLAVTPFVTRLAFRIGAVDQPGDARKIHQRPVARLGGAAIFVAFIVAVAATMSPSRELVTLVLGCGVLFLVGVVDDLRGLSPWTKLVWQIVAAAIALSGGIGITAITNPFGGPALDLTYGRFAVDLAGFHFHIAPIANALSILWMVGLANTVNFLDGLDGLACGVSGIAAFIMFLLSAGPHVNQPGTAILAIILAGAAFGWLPYNFFPARIFMGDSGAYFLGLALAMLAIYSGAKLATAVLVLGFPILDAVWAAVRRMAHRTSPFKADRKHFHHLMLDAGLSQRAAVLIIYAIVLSFGLVALVSNAFTKLILLIALVVIMAAAIGLLAYLGWRRSRRLPPERA